MLSGDTIYFPGADDHLWILVSDINADPDRVVMACFISHKEYLDQSCVVNPGEHPFIKHKSLIDYSNGQLTTNTKLDSLVQEGKAKVRDSVSNELLAKIRNAVRGSNLPLELVEILIEQGIVE